MSTDQIFIEGLEVPCRVGCTEEERAYPQILSFRIEITSDLHRAGASDRMEDSIDYSAAISVIKEVAASKPFCLLEGIAQAICTTVLNNFPLASAVRVRITKKVFADVQNVGIQLFRARNEGRQPE